MFATAIESKVVSIAEKESIVDLVNTSSTGKREVRLQLNHMRLRETGLSFEQVMGTLGIYFHPLPISTLQGTPFLEGTNVLL